MIVSEDYFPVEVEVIPSIPNAEMDFRFLAKLCTAMLGGSTASVPSSDMSQLLSLNAPYPQPP